MKSHPLDSADDTSSMELFRTSAAAETKPGEVKPAAASGSGPNSANTSSSSQSTFDAALHERIARMDQGQ